MWTDTSGNHWFAECHRPDAAVAPGTTHPLVGFIELRLKVMDMGNHFVWHLMESFIHRKCWSQVEIVMWKV